MAESIEQCELFKYLFLFIVNLQHFPLLYYYYCNFSKSFIKGMNSFFLHNLL